MNGIFDADGPLIRMLNKILDCIVLSILWVLFTVPVITSGAAAAALYHTTVKTLRHDRSHIFRTFWNSFKSNFKQSLPVSIGGVVIAFILVVDLWNAWLNLALYGQAAAQFCIFLVLLIAFVTLGFCVCAYMGRFNDKLSTIVRNCGYMLMRHPFKLLPVPIISATAVVVVVLFPITLLLLPAPVVLLLSISLEQVFRIYMTDEDKQAEDERNGKR